MRSLRALAAVVRLNLVCLYHHGKTQRRYALSRHRQLTWNYLDDLQAYYRPPTQRKLRSADNLFLFPEAQMVADEAHHAIALGDFARAHSLIDRGHEVLKEAAHLRLLESIAAHAAAKEKKQR